MGIQIQIHSLCLFLLLMMSTGLLVGGLLIYLRKLKEHRALRGECEDLKLECRDLRSLLQESKGRVQELNDELRKMNGRIEGEQEEKRRMGWRVAQLEEERTQLLTMLGLSLRWFDSVLDAVGSEEPEDESQKILNVKKVLKFLIEISKPPSHEGRSN